MKKELSFFEKIKIFKRWMMKDYGLISGCSFCRSTRIKRTEHIEYKNAYGNLVYIAKYKCKDCASEADIREIWRKV